MGGFNRKQIVGYKDLDGLIRKEHSIAFRITKEEAIDLPEQTFIKRKVQLGKKEKDLYNQIKRSSYAELSNGDKITATTVLTRLLRLSLNLSTGLDYFLQMNIFDLIDLCADLKEVTPKK